MHVLWIYKQILASWVFYETEAVFEATLLQNLWDLSQLQYFCLSNPRSSDMLKWILQKTESKRHVIVADFVMLSDRTSV